VLIDVEPDEDDVLIAEQLDYYRRRAPEYDASLQYDDPSVQAHFSEVLDRFPPRGDTLELACGTGIWTALLAPRVPSLVAVDGSPEMLEQARRRVLHLSVRFLTADLFAWRPERTFETVFFAFWLSHVPPSRFDSFWAMVRSALDPGGQVLFIDTGPDEARYEHFLEGTSAPAVERRLTDGTQGRVIKVLHEPDKLRARLARLGFDTTIESVDAPASYADQRQFFAGRATRK
jgi:trans-aconitate methyltransferase